VWFIIWLPIVGFIYTGITSLLTTHDWITIIGLQNFNNDLGQWIINGDNLTIWLDCNVKTMKCLHYWSLENLVTFHSMVHRTRAVGHDGSPVGGKTMKCHKLNSGIHKIQAMTIPTIQRWGALKWVHDHHIQTNETYKIPNLHLYS
jgi:hypothetical protein